MEKQQKQVGMSGKERFKKKKTRFTKSIKGEEIVESHDHSRPKGTQQIQA